jgi:hypothetical protein
MQKMRALLSTLRAVMVSRLPALSFGPWLRPLSSQLALVDEKS